MLFNSIVHIVAAFRWLFWQYCKMYFPSVVQNSLKTTCILNRAVHRSRSTGAGAPAYFAGAGAGAGVGKLRQKLRQTKLWKIISYFNELLVMEKLSWMLRSDSWPRKFCKRIAIAFDTKIHWPQCILGENTTLPCGFTFYKTSFKQAPKDVYLISRGESSKRNKINSEILRLLLLLNMKFP